MSDPQEEKFPPAQLESTPINPAPPPGIDAESASHTPVTRNLPKTPTSTTVDAAARRDFFSDAMREALAPLAGLLERKINPFLAALESIPNEVERFTQVSLPAITGALDQPQLNSRAVSLPQAGETPETRTRAYLRPPGAMAPGDFESVCSQCGKCVEACPASAIQMDPKQFIADGLPYIIPTNQPCVVCDSLACMKSCPTGALMLVDRLKIKMGTARVDHQQCLRDKGEDCRMCLDACPIMGAASPHGDALIIHAETGRVRVRKNICVGCGLCESRCPTYPQAIQVEAYRAPVDPIIA